MPPNKVSTYLYDEDLEQIRQVAKAAMAKYGQAPTDAAILRAMVAVAQRHREEVMDALAGDLGYGRKGEAG